MLYACKPPQGREGRARDTLYTKQHRPMEDTIEKLLITAIKEFGMDSMEAARAVRDKLVENTPMNGTQAANAVRLVIADMVGHEFSELELDAMKMKSHS